MVYLHIFTSSTTKNNLCAICMPGDVVSHRSAQSRALSDACCRGYINLYTLYIFWLCSAVFVHLPSLQSMGFDVRADITMLITILLLSLLVSLERQKHAA